MKTMRFIRHMSSRYDIVDLKHYEQAVIDTINSIASGKHPEVCNSSFSADELAHSQAVQIERILSRLDELKQYGKQVMQHLLSEGKIAETEPKGATTTNRPRGGRKNDGTSDNQEISQH